MITITPITLPGITLTGNTNTMTTMKAFCQQFSNRGYTERQANGWIIEDFIIHNSNYSELLNQKYNTKEFDCYSKKYNIPVQIKAKKISRGLLYMNNDKKKHIQIELGEGNNGCLPKNSDFILDIITYNTHNMTVNRVLFFIDSNKWNNAINPLNDTILSQHHVFNGITKKHEDDAKWRKRRTEITKEYYDAMPDCKFKPRFKRDHKGQKRVQMAISDWDLVELSSAVYKDDNFKYKIK